MLGWDPTVLYLPMKLQNVVKNLLIIERRAHIGVNMYTHKERGINVHDYGAHIFHTDNKMVWDYINQFTEFNNYINQVVANYKGELL